MPIIVYQFTGLTHYRKTDLNMILDIDGVTEKRLLNALDSFEKMDFERIQNDIFQEAKHRYHLKNVTVHLPLFS